MSVFKTFVFSQTQPGDPFVSPPLGMFHVHINNTGAMEIVNSDAKVVSQNPVLNINSNFTASTSSVLLVNASAQTTSITLPSAEQSYYIKLTVKKIDSSANRVTIVANNSETIDGQATFELSSQYASTTLISDGINWFII